MEESEMIDTIVKYLPIAFMTLICYLIKKQIETNDKKHADHEKDKKEFRKFIENKEDKVLAAISKVADSQHSINLEIVGLKAKINEVTDLKNQNKELQEKQYKIDSQITAIFRILDKSQAKVELISKSKN